MPKKKIRKWDVALIDSWNFNVFEFTNEELCDIIAYIFSSWNIPQRFRIDDSTMNNFLGVVASRYLAENPYHNFPHGCDVCHTVHRLMTLSRLHVSLDDVEIFSMLLAALGHDVGHPGVNNAFLVNSKHRLAMTYNDRSPLENMHAAMFFEIVDQKECNILAGLDHQQWRTSRKIIISTILGTDMAYHFEHISKAQIFADAHWESSQAFSSGSTDEFAAIQSSQTDRIFVMELMMHCSDISHPFKPFRYSSQWAARAMEEFGRQGDQEKALGLPISPMCDREDLDISVMQMDFIENIISPLMTAFIRVLPALAGIRNGLADNFQQWAEMHIDEITKASSSNGEAVKRSRKQAVQSEQSVLDKNVQQTRDKVDAFRLKLASSTELRKKKRKAVEVASVNSSNAVVTRRSGNRAGSSHR